MKSSVLAMRAFSSGNVVSVSAKLGTATPARRAAAPLAWSDMSWTWRASGNMSGEAAPQVSAAGSILRAAA